MDKRHFRAVIVVVSLVVLGILFENSTPVENVTHTAKVVSLDTNPSDSLKNALTEQSKNIVHIDDKVAEDCGSATLFFTSLPAKCLVNGKLVTIEPDIPTAYNEHSDKIKIVPNPGGE